jgi:hypothetical protein
LKTFGFLFPFVPGQASKGRAEKALGLFTHLRRVSFRALRAHKPGDAETLKLSDFGLRAARDKIRWGASL